MTTKQLLEKLRKSGLEEVDAHTSRKVAPSAQEALMMVAFCWADGAAFCWGEEVDARTSRSIVFKINNNKFIHIQESPVVEFEAQESSRSYCPIVFWHFIPKQKKDTTFWERIKIWGVCAPEEFEEHFTRFLNA